MRKILIECESAERLEGFIAGLEYANDSAVEVRTYSSHTGVLLLVDHDGQDGDDREYLLTEEGLE